MRECLDEVKRRIEEFTSEKLKAAGVTLYEKDVDDFMEGIEELLMDALEGYRSIAEVQQIVDAVRAGETVNIPYYDPEIDEDPYIVRPTW